MIKVTTHLMNGQKVIHTLPEPPRLPKGTTLAKWAIERVLAQPDYQSVFNGTYMVISDTTAVKVNKMVVSQEHELLAKLFRNK